MPAQLFHKLWSKQVFACKNKTQS